MRILNFILFALHLSCTLIASVNSDESDEQYRPIARLVAESPPFFSEDDNADKRLWLHFPEVWGDYSDIAKRSYRYRSPPFFDYRYGKRRFKSPPFYGGVWKRGYNPTPFYDGNLKRAYLPPPFYGGVFKRYASPPFYMSQSPYKRYFRYKIPPFFSTLRAVPLRYLTSDEDEEPDDNVSLLRVGYQSSTKSPPFFGENVKRYFSPTRAYTGNELKRSYEYYPSTRNYWMCCARDPSNERCCKMAKISDTPFRNAGMAIGKRDVEGNKWMNCCLRGSQTCCVRARANFMPFYTSDVGYDSTDLD